MRLSAILLISLVGVGTASANEAEKLPDDPTKVITKAGVSYSDFATVSGSIAFGPVTKVNASLSENGEWRLGGSYLFRFGIVNFAASRKELSSGVSQTQYSIGSFMPLTALGAETGQWQLFPMIGFNYTEGQQAIHDTEIGEEIIVSTSSKGGYIGLMGLRPINESWTFKGGLILSAGSNDYTGYGLGGGLTYNITDRDTVSVFASYSDNTFGAREKYGIGYRREF